MSVEDYFTQQFTEDAAIAAHFVEREISEWWFASSSLGLGPNIESPVKPYIVWNEGPDFVHHSVSETSNARNRIFRFYVYDDKGDFTRINAILEEIRRVAKNMAPFVTPDGIRCSASRWDGISGQIPDDGYDASTRFGTLRLTVSA